jgi:hypothetical protein
MVIHSGYVLLMTCSRLALCFEFDTICSLSTSPFVSLESHLVTELGSICRQVTSLLLLVRKARVDE